MCFHVQVLEHVEARRRLAEFLRFGVDELEQARGDLFVPFLVADFGAAGGFFAWSCLEAGREREGSCMLDGLFGSKAIEALRSDECSGWC